MAFDLSFAPEFFELPGESGGAEYPHGDEPYSVFGALEAMPQEDWWEMSQEIFDCRDATHYTVMRAIRETNTCTDLRSPVEVWIDEEGFYTVHVYERGDRPEM